MRFPKSLFTDCMAWPLRWVVWALRVGRAGLEVRVQPSECVRPLGCSHSKQSEPLFFLSTVISFKERVPLISQNRAASFRD